MSRLSLRCVPAVISPSAGSGKRARPHNRWPPTDVPAPGSAPTRVPSRRVMPPPPSPTGWCGPSRARRRAGGCRSPHQRQRRQWQCPPWPTALRRRCSTARTRRPEQPRTDPGPGPPPWRCLVLRLVLPFFRCRVESQQRAGELGFLCRHGWVGSGPPRSLCRSETRHCWSCRVSVLIDQATGTRVWSSRRGVSRSVSGAVW